MKSISFFLLFSYSDDWIFDLQSSSQKREAISATLAAIKKASQNVEVYFYYDVNELNSFIHDLGILDDAHLNNLASQLRYLLGKTARRIDSCWVERPDRFYLRYDRESRSVSLDIPPLLKYLVDTFSEDVGILSFGDKSYNSTERIHFLLDAIEDEDPKVLSYPFFVECDDAAAWVISCSGVGFLTMDRNRFIRTKRVYKRNGSRARVYQQKTDQTYWYLDFFHRENRLHFEVYDNSGNHLGEADRDGNIDSSKKDERKSRYMKELLKQ